MKGEEGEKFQFLGVIAVPEFMGRFSHVVPPSLPGTLFPRHPICRFPC